MDSQHHPWLTHGCISVVLPVYSEEESILQVVDGLSANLGPYLKEVIAIVSPQSPPATLAVCRSLSTQHPYFRFEMQALNPGLGLAVRQGLQSASGDYVLFIDSDGEMEVSSAALMVAKLESEDLDLIVASRWMQSGSMVGYHPIKLQLNRLFQLFNQVLFGLKISDCSLGYKLLKRSFAAKLHWTGSRHEIALETTLRPILAGARYSQVPTRWMARTRGSSKNSWSNNFRYLGMSLSLFYGKIFGKGSA